MRFNSAYPDQPELILLSYPVRLVRTTEGKVRVIFLDVPEAVAEAATEEDALYQARFALDLSLGNYVLHDRPIPTPTELPGAPVVTTDKFSAAADQQAPEGTGHVEEVGEAETAPGGDRY
jgi:predicted RNase H-like HicB family nuclease